MALFQIACNKYLSFFDIEIFGFKIPVGDLSRPS